MEDSSIIIDDSEAGGESKMNGDSVEIIVEDDDDEKEEEKEETENDNSEESKVDKRVFVKKKIPNDEEWFAQISEKEMKYYKKHVLVEKELDESTVVCTACFRQVNHKHAGAVVRHPDLGVPICKQCKKFYHMGEWTRGEDGFFEYCRWCANGGDLLLCDSCSNAFCKKCIKRNLGRSKVSEIEELEEWNCLACEPKQVWKQRSMYYSVWIYQKNLLATEQEKEVKKKKEEKTNFIDETLKDGFDVNKILGNYLDRAKKSWSRKSQDYNHDDLAKVVVKLRTVIKIAHHNLQLLDKNLVTGCQTSFPGIDLAKLAPLAIPDDNKEETSNSEKNSEENEKEEEAEKNKVVDDAKNNCDLSSLNEDAELLISAKNTVKTDESVASLKTSVEDVKEEESLQKSAESESMVDTVDLDSSKQTKGQLNTEETIETNIDSVEIDKAENRTSNIESSQKEKSDVSMTEVNKKSSEEATSEDCAVGEDTRVKEVAAKDESMVDKISNSHDVSKDMFSNSDAEDERSVKSPSPIEKQDKTQNKINNEPQAQKSAPVAEDIDLAKVDGMNGTLEGDTENMDTSNVAEDLNDTQETLPDEEDIDSEEANARARAAVLQTTSSESEQANIGPTETTDNSPRKKLKTKKVLDQMRRKSAGTEDASVDHQVSSGDDKKIPTTPKSKKKPKILSSTPIVRQKDGSESDSASGKDLLGITDDESNNKAKKKTGLKKKKKMDDCSDESPEKKKKKKKGSKSSSSDSGGSDIDSDEKAYRRKQKKREKRNLKMVFEELNKMASKVNIEENKQLNKETRVNIQYLNRDIKTDLKNYDEVDVTSHSILAKLSTGKSAKDRDIDRLCDFKSLKKSRRTSEETDSEEDGPGRKKEKLHREKREKKAATGLGDMSSDSNGEHHSNKEDSEEEQRPEGFKSQNDLAKAAVLATSSEDENGGADPSSDEQEKTPEKKEKVKKEKKPKKVLSDTESEPSKPKRKNKPALLSMKLSETETSEDEAKYRSKMEKKAASAKEIAMESDNSPDSSDVAQSSAQKKKPSKKRKILSSDENGADSESASEESAEEEESEYEESDSSVDKKKKRNRRRKSSSSDDSDSDRPKKKRKRIKTGTDSEEEKDELTSPNKGRHEIRRILKDKHLTEETKEAAVEERERRKRIEERQALYNKTFTLPEGKKDGENVTGQLVLDFHPETMEVLVEVNKKLVKKLKPHQAKGVKFMWDACYESIAQIKSGKNPGGAILAHCMGLGKTLQTVTLTHTLLDNRKVPVNRAMVICPVNTVKNWQDEYDKWLKGDLEIDVFEMSAEKDNWGRADKLNQWFREGGVLIIGYEMFRNLVNEKNNKFKKKQREIFNNCLLDPGPDLVICDEGHLLKNEKSAITKAVNRIKTLRRIVLTGTPLQNNLKEYFEMVNFVKPHLLGTRKEFMNRFVNPIVNGQHSDSTERDVRTMKKRSFILSDLLKGCMQRLDYNVLVPYLQPKQEYVISISMTDLQKKLYKYYLENYAKAGQIGPDGKLEGGKKGGLFYDVQNLSRIWNHPCILLLAKQRKEDKEDLDDEEGSLKDFICDEDEDDSGNDDSDIQEIDSDGTALVKKVATRSDKPDDLVDGLDDAPIGGHKGWWNSFLGDGDKLDELKFGNKMVLLMDVLKESALIGDKVLVFSQSLLSLDLIEDFLSRVNAAHEDTDRTGDSAMADYLDTWIPGKDYYRMDGSTAAETRKIWCKYFNRTTSHRMRLFLISTKAGGLGINLVAANRVIIFDASWNPSHDVQSIFRVFRFGQTKPVYIYRFLAKGTMEEKIYDRQVTKQSLSARVVDEQQIERHFTMNELSELYEFNDEPESARPIPVVPEDRLLAELVDKHKALVWGIKNHDSLLENQVDENLTADERKAAWAEYEQERKGMIQTNVGIENTQQFGQMLQTMLPKSGDGRIMASPINPMAIQAQLRQMNPELSHEELVARTRAAIMQLQNMHRTQTPVIVNQNTLNVGQRNTTGYDQSYYQAEMAKAKAMINQQYPGMYRFGFRGPNPHSPGGMPGVSNMRRPGAGPAPSHGEVITLDGGPETAPPPMARMPVRAASPAQRGGGRGRGGRRGRPRLDPDTDLDFSPEPSNTAHNEMLLARLQQAGMTVSPASGSKPSSGNES